MNNEAIAAFLQRLDMETTVSVSNVLTHEQKAMILQKGVRSLIDALNTTVKTKETTNV